MHGEHKTPRRLIKTKAALDKLGCGNSFFYAKIAPNLTKVQLSEKAVRWFEDEIDALIEARTVRQPQAA